MALFKLASFYGIKLINTVFGHEALMGSKLIEIVGSAAHIAVSYTHLTLPKICSV